MNVQELFIKADPERVFYGYTIIRPVFDDFEPISLEDQTLAYVKLKEHIADVCDVLKTCEIDMGNDPRTLFVMKRRSTVYGESYLGDLENWVLKDRDVLEALDKDFRIWDDEGEMRIPHYGIDFVPVTTLAGYTVASESVNHMGINICCATILRGLFMWGFTDEAREKRLEELEADLDAGLKGYEEGRVYTHEEVMEKLENELFANSSEDEKEHRRLEKEYKKSVKEIENRYIEKVIQEDHQFFIDAVKYEFRNRK